MGRYGVRNANSPPERAGKEIAALAFRAAMLKLSDLAGETETQPEGEEAVTEPAVA